MARLFDVICYTISMVIALLLYDRGDTQGAIFFALVSLWFQPKDK